MKLYELQRGDMFTLVEEPGIPPDMSGPDLLSVYKFISLVGMYSISKDHLKRTYLFAAWTEVNKIEIPYT